MGGYRVMPTLHLSGKELDLLVDVVTGYAIDNNGLNPEKYKLWKKT